MTKTDRIQLAIVQCELGAERVVNVDRVVGLIEESALAGAQVVLTPELFEGPYFPQLEDEEVFELAQPLDDSPTLKRLRALARARQIVLTYSFFERAGPHYYNSLAVIDADGSLTGVYRKAHIPDGPGYEEKFYFRPGQGAFRVFSTRYGRLGAAICWDQWFPECARALALGGADVLLYPTAIGSEPESGEDTRDPWQRVMIGHAVANALPVAAANRVGTEKGLDFYGSSFVCDPRGDKLVELGRTESAFALTELDLVQYRRRRASWGFFRDRRPELYQALSRAPDLDVTKTFTPG